MEVQSWSVSTFNLLAISSIFLGTSLNLKKKAKRTDWSVFYDITDFSSLLK